MDTKNSIDISENSLRGRGRILDILLLDRTRSEDGAPHNIIWATDDYAARGSEYAFESQITVPQITGENGRLIQPRAAKSREEQRRRTKDKAEVFTPLFLVKMMNDGIDEQDKNWPATAETWRNYVSELRLEITCGEAPFIASRYDPTASTGVVIAPAERVGFLDRKLQVVAEFVESAAEWLEWAEVAVKGSYGYEWQGDNLLIARENVLLTVDDFYTDFCAQKLGLAGEHLTTGQLEDFAEIISWNIWQMDGLKYVIPMSCKPVIAEEEILGLFSLPGEEETEKVVECKGCLKRTAQDHSGIYAKIMDWRENKTLRFSSLITKIA